MTRYKFRRLWQTYIVRATLTRLYKIGRTMDIAARLAELRTGSPDALELVASFPEDYESELHAKFAAFRRHGEWFAESPELVDFLNTPQLTNEDVVRSLLTL
jgi:hypothetical protein